MTRKSFITHYVHHTWNTPLESAPGPDRDYSHSLENHLYYPNPSLICAYPSHSHHSSPRRIWTNRGLTTSLDENVSGNKEETWRVFFVSFVSLLLEVWPAQYSAISFAILITSARGILSPLRLTRPGTASAFFLWLVWATTYYTLHFIIMQEKIYKKTNCA